MTRRATCVCGQLQISCEGEPVRVSVCYCTGCQKRTGSAFGAQARFAVEHVKVEGRAASYERAADSGNRITFSFCPACGSTVFWENLGIPDFTTVALGAFADPEFPEPTVTVYEVRRPRWLPALDGPGVEHMD